MWVIETSRSEICMFEILKKKIVIFRKIEIMELNGAIFSILKFRKVSSKKGVKKRQVRVQKRVVLFAVFVAHFKTRKKVTFLNFCTKLLNFNFYDVSKVKSLSRNRKNKTESHVLRNLWSLCNSSEKN